MPVVIPGNLGDTYEGYVEHWGDWGPLPDGWRLLTQREWERRRARMNGWVPDDPEPMSLWEGLWRLMAGMVVAVLLVAMMLVLYPNPKQSPPSSFPQYTEGQHTP